MAGPVDNEFLIQAATYLGATAIAVPIFKRLKLGTILGFLAAGVVLGEHGFGLLRAEEGVFHVAELGVVLFLFVIGLEVSVSRLWNLRHGIFGLGLCQMLITGLIIAFCLNSLGIMSQNAALIAGFALACSSTAFALSLLEERGELNTPYGTKAFSVLLFQDLAVIPLLAAIPFAATSLTGNAEAVDIEAIGKTAGVIIALIVVARFGLNSVLKLIAVSGSREAFAAAALFVVAATALAVSSVGLSMALGAFLAGVMLADSTFRHQIESDIEPFRELLLGLFFIGVGMQLDLGVIAGNLLLVVSAALLLVAFKAGIIFLLARLFRAGKADAARTGAILSQGGEFAFVVFSLGAAQNLFDTGTTTLMSAIVTLSMITTPVLMMLANRLNFSSPASPEAVEELKEMQGEVLVVGFGRMGQIISQVLHSSGVNITTVDRDPARIETAKRFGNKVYYGDGYNVNLLLTAGVLSANAIVFAVNDGGRLKQTIAALREKCPKLKIIVRAHDRLHEMELLDSSADHIVRETLESSLDIAGRTLSGLGKSDAFIADATEEFRLRDREILLKQKAGDIYAGKDRLREPFSVVSSNSKEKDRQSTS